MTLGSVLNDSGLNRYMLPPGTAKHVMILRNDIMLERLFASPATSPPYLFHARRFWNQTEELVADSPEPRGIH